MRWLQAALAEGPHHFQWAISLEYKPFIPQSTQHPSPVTHTSWFCHFYLKGIHPTCFQICFQSCEGRISVESMIHGRIKEKLRLFPEPSLVRKWEEWWLPEWEMVGMCSARHERQTQIYCTRRELQLKWMVYMESTQHRFKYFHHKI